MKPFYLLCTLLLASPLSNKAQSFTVHLRIGDSMPLNNLVVTDDDGLKEIEIEPANPYSRRYKGIPGKGKCF